MKFQLCEELFLILARPFNEQKLEGRDNNILKLSAGRLHSIGSGSNLARPARAGQEGEIYFSEK